MAQVRLTRNPLPKSMAHQVFVYYYILYLFVVYIFADYCC